MVSQNVNVFPNQAKLGIVLRRRGLHCDSILRDFNLQ
jgi:hypothetical protein